MNHNYFEKLKELNDLNPDNKADVEPAYPVVDGVVWPPRNLEDVINNCSIWREFGFFDPDELPNDTVQQNTEHNTFDNSKILKYRNK